MDARRKEYDKAGQAGARQQRQALLMGLLLDTAKKWLAARRGDIEPADQAFIEASVRAERAVARTGGQARRLTATPNVETEPYFSPDGSKIVLSWRPPNVGSTANVWEDDAWHGIVLVPADGGRW